MRVWLKRLGILLLCLLVVVGGYVAYVMLTYYRVEDNLALDVNGSTDTTISTDTTYRISSANIGFGAYSDDYSFFMDGGEYSRALSEDAVYENVTGDVDYVKSLDADIMLFQEVDVDGTRSYHVDEYALITETLEDDYSSVFAQNYDSPYLMYPLTSPHGANQSGIATYSSFTIDSSIRRSLPIETGFSKFLDLDRCYSKSYIDVDSDTQLVVYNLHLSAYTTNEQTATNQLVMLFEDMQEEYDKGNYVIGGGDFNKDLLGDSYEIFKQGEVTDANWAKPIPEDIIPSDFLVTAPFDEEDPVPSCRNSDIPYSKDNFVVTVDGFITSKNITVEYANVLDTQFKYSDHNPVYMDFKLQ